MKTTREERVELEQAAREDCRLAYGFSRAHARLAAWAERRHGNHGPLISGVVREHFPEVIKGHLRRLALGVAFLNDRSIRRWRLARKRRATWLRMKDATIARDGRGFYG